MRRSQTVEKLRRSLQPAVSRAISATDKPRAHVRRAASRYRQARKSLHTPASNRSRRGLDWANFLIADVQAGFGAFVAFYLANLGWSQEGVGIALGLSGAAGVLGQIPGGTPQRGVAATWAFDAWIQSAGTSAGREQIFGALARGSFHQLTLELVPGRRRSTINCKSEHPLKNPD